MPYQYNKINITDSIHWYLRLFGVVFICYIDLYRLMLCHINIIGYIFRIPLSSWYSKEYSILFSWLF